MGNGFDWSTLPADPPDRGGRGTPEPAAAAPGERGGTAVAAGVLDERGLGLAVACGVEEGRGDAFAGAAGAAGGFGVGAEPGSGDGDGWGEAVAAAQPVTRVAPSLSTVPWLRSALLPAQTRRYPQPAVLTIMSTASVSPGRKTAPEPGTGPTITTGSPLVGPVSTSRSLKPGSPLLTSVPRTEVRRWVYRFAVKLAGTTAVLLTVNEYLTVVDGGWVAGAGA